MATFYCSPTATGSGSGTLASPWNVSQANNMASGNTCEFRGGIYTTDLRPVNNNTIWKRYLSENPTWDGSRLAVPLLKATPLMFTDVPSETGWATQAYNNSQGQAEANVFSKSISGIHSQSHIFADSFDGEDGALVAGKYVILWNMTAYLTPGYGGNPNGEIHDGALYSHDNATFRQSGAATKKHFWQSQFMTPGGTTVYIRLWGGSPNPSSHKVYITNKSAGISIVGKSGMTFDGLKFYRYKNCVDCRSSTNCIFQNCWFMYGGSQVIHNSEGSHNNRWENNKIYGGGSSTAHLDECISLHNANFTQWINNDIGWGGHGGIMHRDGSHDTLIRGNTIHDCAGSQLTFALSSNMYNVTVENNIFRGGNKGTDISLHLSSDGAAAPAMDPHAAIQIGHLRDSVFQRNLIYDVGRGILMAGSNTNPTQNVIFRHNTFADIEFEHLRVYQDSGGTDLIRNNYWGNNIFYSSIYPDATLLIRMILGASTTANDFRGNKFDNNLFYLPGAGQPRTCIQVSKASGNNFTGNVAGANSQTQLYAVPTSSVLFSGNIQATAAVAGLTPPLYRITGAPAQNAGTTAASAQAPPYNGAPDIGHWEIGGGGGGGDTTPPTATITQCTPLSGIAPLTVSITGTSSDNVGVTAIEWVFGDGTPNETLLARGQGTAFTHQYVNAGNYTLQFRARDAALNWSTIETRQITVTTPGGGPNELTVFGHMASSAIANQPEDEAFDGILWENQGDNYWSGNPLPQWLAADVGGSVGARKLISEVRLNIIKWNFTPARIYTLNIQVADADNPIEGDWQTVLSNVQSSAASFSNFVFPTERTARWVRAYLISSSDATQYGSIGEMKVYGEDVPVGQEGQEYTPTTATDTDASSGVWGPLKAVSGNGPEGPDPLNRWKAFPLPKSHITDLGSAKAVGRVRIASFKSGLGYVYTIQIETATNIGGPWTNVVPSRTSTVIDYEDFTFAVVTARYVRITYHASPHTIQASLWRVKVFAS